MKAQWTAGRFNVHNLNISPAFRIQLEYTNAGYVMHFAGGTKQFDTTSLDIAKSLAVNFARKVFKHALNELE
jgi:hypothetical protein